MSISTRASTWTRVASEMQRLALAGILLLLASCMNEHRTSDRVSFGPSLSTELRSGALTGESSLEPMTSHQHHSLAGLTMADKETVPTTSGVDVALWQPRAENILPLPWVEFHEVYSRKYWPEEHPILSIAEGVLQIEDKCVYLDRGHAGIASVVDHPSVHQPRRSVLSLPSDLMQYDQTKDELWFHHRITVAGPFSSGDEIKVNDAKLRSVQSAACGNHHIMSGSSIEDCGFLHGRYRFPCTVAAYSATHGVLPAEANRRLERIPQMEAVLAALRDAEPHRIAGWGIDQALPYTQDGESFVAWLWLIGDDPAQPLAQAIADGHPDVEIRTGASATHAQLQAAQQRFADGDGIFLPHDDLQGIVEKFELSDVTAWTWIDLRSNALEIAVDTDLIPRPTASLMLTGDHEYDKKFGGLPMAQLPAEIAAEIQHLINAPFVISDWRIDPES